MKMKRILTTVFGALLWTGALFMGSAQATSFLPESFADLVDKHSKAVVNISTSTKPRDIKNRQKEKTPFTGDPFFDRFFEDFFGGMPEGPRGREFRTRPQQSLGSGVIISEDGYIVTNNHVISKADDIVVKFQDNTELKAEVVGKDPKNDLALLKVEAGIDLPFSVLGDSEKIRVGDWAIAIGNPFGLGGSVTAGIISARGRNIQQGPYDNFLQTDAAINPGNSGGPLFNKNGEIIGINTAILSRTGGSQGIGFAVPSNTVKFIVEQIKEHGKPVRGWLGVRIQTVTKELAEALDLKETKGALVATVVEGSPAEKAGIEDGDLILKYNGKNVEEMVDLPKMVAETEINKTVGITVMRNGKQRTLKVKIAELEEDDEGNVLSDLNTGSDEIEIAGMTLSELTDDERDALGVDASVEGVVVTSVAPGTRARNSRLRAGDIILEMNKQKIKSTTDVTDIIESKEGKPLLMLILRGGNKHFLAFKKTEES
jgi:serine protease Do